MLLTVLEGSLSSRSAQAPATCGAAIEVPLSLEKLPPGTDDKMPTPGASRSTIPEKLELGAMVSRFVVMESFVVVLPTVIALEMHAGAATASVKPSLPEAITVAIPAAFRLSMMALRSAYVVSQLRVYRPAPKLMFTEAKERVSLSW